MNNRKKGNGFWELTTKDYRLNIRLTKMISSFFIYKFNKKIIEHIDNNGLDYYHPEYDHVCVPFNIPKLFKINSPENIFIKVPNEKEED